MSKKQFKSQASSSRAFSATFGEHNEGFGGGAGAALGFGSISSSPLSYIYEPPDLSQITESGAVVAFKNLQKKDSTTKTKALEGLQNHFTSLTVGKKEIGDAVLQAWIKIYPRTSIDNEPRVRQLAHTVQGQISISCGKRIAKFMPMVIGPWLAGTFDNDKRVMRAALNAFTQLFPSEEKQKNLWRIYQPSIIKYCRDVILKESIRSLSDERTTSPDDAKAKYARVTGSALLLVVSVLTNLSRENIDKEWDSYEKLLKNDQLWKLAAYDDSFVRRAVYRLLFVIINKEMEHAVDLETIGRHLLVEALPINQTGSAFEYAKTLARATVFCPELWTTYYIGSGKKAADKRLGQFLRRGSQGGPPEFWMQVKLLLEQIPLEVLAAGWNLHSGDSSETARVFHPVLLALREGVTRKDEHQSGQLDAWFSFLRLFELLLQQQELPIDKVSDLLHGTVWPVVEQYIRPNPKTMEWNITGPHRQEICVAATTIASKILPESFEQNWQRLSQDVIEDFQASLPEQSRDYLKSQDAIVHEINRWYKLQAAILCSNNTPASVESTLELANLSQVNAAIKSVSARNGKPYSCMAVLISAIQDVPEVTIQKDKTRSVLVEFAETGVTVLLTSPSLPYIITFLDELEKAGYAQGLRKATVDALLNSPESTGRTKSLETLLASQWLGDDIVSKQLLSFVEDKFQEFLQGNTQSRTLSLASIQNSAVPSSLLSHFLERITESLISQDKAEISLDALSIIFKYNIESLRRFLGSYLGSTLLLRLLELASDSKMPSAQQLNSSLYTYISEDTELQKSLKGDYLILMAKQLSTNDQVHASDETDPATTCNTKAYREFVNSADGFAFLSRVMALTGGDSKNKPSDAMTTTTAIHTLVTAGDRELGRFYLLTIELTENLKQIDSAEAANSPHRDGLHHQIVYYYNLIGNMLYNSIDVTENSHYPTKPEYIHLAQNIYGVLPGSESYLPFGAQRQLDLIQGYPELFASTAVLSEHLRLKDFPRMCNQYIGNISGLNFQKGNEALRQLMLLNGLLVRTADLLKNIPQPRIVFFVRHLVAALREHIQTPHIVVELFQCLSRTLASIKNIYGSVWAELLEQIMQIWSWQSRALTAQLPTVYSSVGLFSALRELWHEGSNDDLQDIFSKKQEDISISLVRLLKHQSDVEDEIYPRQETFNALLASVMRGQRIAQTTDIQEIYPILACDSPSLQQAAYQILLEIIPKAQEELSVEAALTQDFSVKLPEELLSLILASPMSLEIDVFNMQGSMPSVLRSYLLSWKLVFAHWTNSSYRLQTDYADSLKEGQYLNSLLDYTFEFLIGSRPRPIDASKYNLTQYDTDVYDSPEEETAALLVHLCYICMTHLPLLTKSWWRDQCPRQLQKRVEEWVEKYISSAVIHSELTTVLYWIPTHDTSDEPLEIRISPKAREITASFPLDDQFIAIAIRLPPAYPLHPVSVETVNRVGVDEKKWRSWLITTQGVINFSSSGGSLIDGLVAWKRKVAGTLKNQSECAICYSVVSGDKQLPSKQCGTCRKLFHSSCLFRWFKSSNSSSCPLCRNPFNYA